jgi:hypothetical protein
VFNLNKDGNSMTNKKLFDVIAELNQAVVRVQESIPMLVKLLEADPNWLPLEVGSANRLLLDRLTITAVVFARLAVDFSDATGTDPNLVDVSSLHFWGNILERKANKSLTP